MNIPDMLDEAMFHLVGREKFVVHQAADLYSTINNKGQVVYRWTVDDSQLRIKNIPPALRFFVKPLDPRYMLAERISGLQTKLTTAKARLAQEKLVQADAQRAVADILSFNGRTPEQLKQLYALEQNITAESRKRARQGQPRSVTDYYCIYVDGERRYFDRTHDPILDNATAAKKAATDIGTKIARTKIPAELLPPPLDGEHAAAIRYHQYHAKLTERERTVAECEADVAALEAAIKSLPACNVAALEKERAQIRLSALARQKWYFKCRNGEDPKPNDPPPPPMPRWYQQKYGTMRRERSGPYTRPFNGAGREFPTPSGSSGSMPPPPPKSEDGANKIHEEVDTKQFVLSLGITTRREWREWMTRNHPDKGGNLETCQRVVGYAKTMGWCN